MSLDPQAIRLQVEQVADAVDRHFEAVFASVKSSFENSQWIPESVRPPPKSLPKPPAPLSYLQHTKRWVDQNRAIAAAILAFAGTTAFLLYRGQRSQRRKRRARRVGAHGAKVEAVVLAGPPESPLTRSLAHDLEKRGFLVYIPVETAADEQLVRAEGRDDIRPLHLDLSSAQATSRSLTAFTDALATVTRSQRVHVAALLVVPALDAHPRLPLAALSSRFWSGSLFVHLQRPVDLVHAFLPLLQAQDTVPGKGGETQRTSVVVLSRGITAALPLPGHGTESVAHAALSAYLRTLKAECPALAVSHLQLGAIDLGAQAEGRSQLVLHPRSRSNSPPDARSVLGRLGRADMTPAKMLHYAVFDAVTGRTTGTTFVGRGARTYAWVGRYGPVALVRWMVGGQVPEEGREAAAAARPVRRGSEEWEELNRSSDSIREETGELFA